MTYRRTTAPACSRKSSTAERLWRRTMPVLAHPAVIIGVKLISIACAGLVPVAIISGAIVLAVTGFVACLLFAFVADLGIDCWLELKARP